MRVLDHAVFYSPEQLFQCHQVPLKEKIATDEKMVGHDLTEWTSHKTDVDLRLCQNGSQCTCLRNGVSCCGNIGQHQNVIITESYINFTKLMLDGRLSFYRHESEIGETKRDILKACISKKDFQETLIGKSFIRDGNNNVTQVETLRFSKMPLITSPFFQKPRLNESSKSKNLFSKMPSCYKGVFRRNYSFRRRKGSKGHTRHRSLELPRSTFYIGLDEYPGENGEIDVQKRFSVPILDKRPSTKDRRFKYGNNNSAENQYDGIIPGQENYDHTDSGIETDDLNCLSLKRKNNRSSKSTESTKICIEPSGFFFTNCKQSKAVTCGKQRLIRKEARHGTLSSFLSSNLTFYSPESLNPRSCLTLKVENGEGENLSPKFMIESSNSFELRQLIDRGIDLDVSDGEGNTLLHYAATNGDIKIIETLLENGVNVWMRNRRKQLAVDLASNLRSKMLLSVVTLFYIKENCEQKGNHFNAREVNYQL